MSWRKALHAKNDKIYIVPTGHGLIFLTGIVVMVLTGATYGNNLIYLLAFMLFSVVMIGMVQTHNNLRKVNLRPLRIDGGFAKEWVQVSVILSHKIKVRRQNLSVGLAKSKCFESRVGTIKLLPPAGSGRVTLQLKSLKRGVYELPRWRLETKYPMGLFKAWKYLDLKNQITVYPELKGEKTLPKARSETLGKESFREKPGDSQEMDFKEHRVYQTGESHRHIDWKIVARRGEYLTKKFEGEGGSVYRFSFSKLSREKAEEKLSQLAVWVHEAYLRKLAFELHLPGRQIKSGRGLQHYRDSLKELALFEVGE